MKDTILEFQKIEIDRAAIKFRESMENITEKKPKNVLRSKDPGERRSLDGLPWEKISGIIRGICTTDNKVIERLSDSSLFKKQIMTYDDAVRVVGATRTEIAQQCSGLNSQDLKKLPSWYITYQARNKSSSESGISSDDIYE